MAIPLTAHSATLDITWSPPQANGSLILTIDSPAPGVVPPVLMGDGHGGWWQLNLELTTVETDVIRGSFQLLRHVKRHRRHPELVAERFVFDTTTDVSRVDRGREKMPFERWELTLEYTP